MERGRLVVGTDWSVSTAHELRLAAYFDPPLSAGGENRSLWIDS